MSINKQNIFTMARGINREFDRALTDDGAQTIADAAQVIADDLVKHVDEYAATLALINAMMEDESSMSGQLKYLSSDYGPDAANDFRFAAEEKLDILLDAAFDIRNHL